MIVYGHNNFNLLTVTPLELGMLDKNSDNVRFQLRQRYGHLFWIPFISLGTMWVVNRGDGQLYHCPPDIERTLRERYPKRGSIFAWSGILLCLLIFLIYTVSNSIEDHNNKKRRNAEYAATASTLSQNVDKIRAGQFLLVSGKDEGSQAFNWQSFPLKVLGVTGNNILLGTYAENYSSAKTTNGDEGIVEMDIMNSIVDSFTITKEELKKGVPLTSGEDNSITGFRLKDFYLGGTFKLTDIRDLEGPQLVENSSAEGKSSTYFEILNKGFNVTADSIITKTAGLSWAVSKKHFLGHNETIAVRSDAKGEAILYCSDNSGKKYRYLIDTRDYIISITRMAE